jgi:glycosyltransferase involved in cell wall biosynthesis
MTVSVIIPAYNAESFLAAAIESVLAQTRPPVELIVVDDGSTDGSARIAAGYGRNVRCLTQRNAGVASARNNGAAQAASEWLAFLDADDIWLPQKLHRQLEAIGDSDCACFTAIRVVDHGGHPREDRGTAGTRLDLEAFLMHDDRIPQTIPSTMLVRRDVFLSLGGFDEHLSTAADWDLLIRLRLYGTLAYVPEPLVHYRRHASNMSRDVPLLERDSRLVLAKAFDAAHLPADARRLRRRALAWNDMVLSGSYFWSGAPGAAFRLGARAVLRDPALVWRAVGMPLRQLQRMCRRQPSPRGR